MLKRMLFTITGGVVAFTILACSGCDALGWVSNLSPTFEATMTAEAAASATQAAQPTNTPTLTSTPMVLPLVAQSTDWRFVVQRVVIRPSLVTTGNRTITPKHGVYLILEGDLENNSNTRGCLTGVEWKLVNDTTREEYDVDYYAADIVKGMTNLDYPGAFVGICVESGQTRQTFVVFDVNESWPLTLWFRKSYGGQPLQINTALALASAITVTPTVTPRLTSTRPTTPRPTNTVTPIVTVTSGPTQTATPTPTNTVTPTVTATPGPTQTATPMPTNTATPPVTVTPEPTQTATPAPTNTVTPTVTSTPLPTQTATSTPTVLVPATLTSSPTAQPLPTATQ